MGLFDDYVSISEYITDKIMNELVSTWMEVVVAPFQLSTQQFPGGNEKAARTTVRTVNRQAKTEPLTPTPPRSS